MSFKFSKKAIVTGLSSVEAGKVLVYAQTIKRISSQNSFSVDGNIFCVDIGAAASKKQSKKECRWLPEEVENAGISLGTIITVNGKERYVKTEVKYGFENYIFMEFQCTLMVHLTNGFLICRASVLY